MPAPLLVIGTIGFDTVSNCRGRAERVIGGSGSYASVSASYFSKVNLISIVGKDFTAAHRAYFERAGVDLRGVKIAGGKTFFWAADYDKDFKNAFTKTTDLNVFADFKPEIIPQYKNCRDVFLGNIEPQIQLSVIRQMHNPRLVASDTMNYWINSDLKSVKQVIKKSNILFLSETEARAITGEYNLIKAGRDILKIGAGHVIIKLGPNGAMLVSPQGLMQLPPVLVEEVYDTTGAGDTFGGAFTGFLAGRKNWNTFENLKTAMACGTVMASFCIESFSINRLAGLGNGEIKKRLNGYYKKLHF